ncbi:MAG: PD-(D/E)XK nuclease family protein [Thermincolia bacterium]
MNQLQRNLAEICQNHKLQEKLLVVPTLAAGHQLLEALAKEGAVWINVRPITPYGLALAVAEGEISQQGATILTKGQILCLLEEGLRDMEEQGQLQYFAPLQQAGDLAQVLAGPITELRLAGVSSQDLDPVAFVDEQKGEELKILLARYEEKLRDKSWVDTAEVYRIASGVLDRSDRGKNPVFIIPEQLELEPVAVDFLVKLTEGCRVVVGEEASQVNPGDIEIFHSYGLANEVREVLRRIKKGAIPLDQAAIYYTTGETYIPLIYSISARLGIPVAFSEGVPITFTRPGRLALELLRWIEGNYSSTLLYRIMTGGDVELPEPDKELGAEILAQMPALDQAGQVGLAEFCQGLGRVVDKYAKVAGEMDAYAMKDIEENLEEAAQAYPGRVTEREAIKRLRLWLGGLYIGARGPQPGRLYVADYRQGGWESRQYNFVVGLDSDSFPGSGLQDPVLLDSERKGISSALRLRSIGPRENLYRMARLLASRRGKVVLSYPCFKTAGGRASSPAALLLQVYRLAGGNHEADYTQMFRSLGAPVSYVPEEAENSLSEEEWWGVKALSDQGLQAGLDRVRACYAGLDAGLAAEEAREGKVFSAYDGKVPVEAEGIDPRLNKEVVLSATQLEKLATCPFSYFLRYVLGIKPPDEVEAEAGAWLDPLARGSLLHDIYCRYMRKACTGEGALEHSKEMLMEIAEELIGDTKNLIPPPNPVIYETEKEQLLRGLEVFWRLEEGNKGDTIPAYFEVPFGFGEEEVQEAGLGLAQPVELPLADGKSIRLRGRIDRIDRNTADGSYEVWDYKTGGASVYEDRDYLKQGRQVQHALYAWVLEELLRISGQEPQARVEVGGYIFPTEKGEGRRVARDQRGRGRLAEALGKMLDLVATGTFCASHDENRCGYCDYQIVCRYPTATQRLKAMAGEEENRELEPWKELQGYE